MEAIKPSPTSTPENGDGGNTSPAAYEEVDIKPRVRNHTPLPVPAATTEEALDDWDLYEDVDLNGLVHTIEGMSTTQENEVVTHSSEQAYDYVDSLPCLPVRNFGPSATAQESCNSHTVTDNCPQVEGRLSPSLPDTYPESKYRDSDSDDDLYDSMPEDVYEVLPVIDFDPYYEDLPTSLDEAQAPTSQVTPPALPTPKRNSYLSDENPFDSSSQTIPPEHIHEEDISSESVIGNNIGAKQMQKLIEMYEVLSRMAHSNESTPQEIGEDSEAPGSDETAMISQDSQLHQTEQTLVPQESFEPETSEGEHKKKMYVNLDDQNFDSSFHAGVSVQDTLPVKPRSSKPPKPKPRKLKSRELATEKPLAETSTTLNLDTGSDIQTSSEASAVEVNLSESVSSFHATPPEENVESIKDHVG